MAMPNPTEEQIQELADTCGGSLYSGYSGRSMYGKEVTAIRCDDPDDVREAAAVMGVRRPTTDQLGKGYVAYWP